MMLTIRGLCLVSMLSLAPLAAQEQVRPGYVTPYREPGLGPQGSTVPAAILEYYHALGWLKSYASKLEASLGGRLPETRQALGRIQEDAAFLQKKWLEWPRLHPGQNPYPPNMKFDRYLRAVQGAYKQLNEVRKASDQAIAETVKFIAADIHAKAENCRHSADGLGKDIAVTIRTRKGTEEFPGYEVWCAPMALVRFKDDHIRFPRISSPTTIKSMAPGFYAMWLVKDNQKTQAIGQTVGGRGETELEIDLLIPGDAPLTPAR